MNVEALATDIPIDALADLLRSQPLDFTRSPAEFRKEFDEKLALIPVSAEVTIKVCALGGVPALRFDPPKPAERRLLYFHGGAYVMGSARGYAALAANLALACGAIVYAPDYRLAPENPYPAAVEDGVAAYRALLTEGRPDRIAVSGDSAGGGLALHVLVKAITEGMPSPRSLTMFSPWVDLACTGKSMQDKAAADPSLTREGLRIAAAYYAAGSGGPAALEQAPLAGLPPTLIQVGSNEILLDDAVLAARALGAADVPVKLEIWPKMIHVWQAFAPMLLPGREAIAAAGKHAFPIED